MADESKAITTTTSVTEKPGHASWVKKFVERAKGEIKPTTPASAAPYMKAGGSVLRTYGESAVTGALLGTTRAMFGDGPANAAAAAVAGLGAVASVAAAGHFPEAAQDMRQVGAAAAAILSDRGAETLIRRQRGVAGIAPKPGPGKSKIAGEDDNDEEDPILKAAKGLG